MAGQVGSLEFPFVPAGYDPAYVYAQAQAYAQQRAGYQPHMVMQEGHVEVRDGVPGVYIKYNTPQGSSTEWTPLPPMAQQAAAPPTPAAPTTDPFGNPYYSGPENAPTVDKVLAGPPPAASDGIPRTPDAQNQAAVAYAQMRLRELHNLGGISDQQYVADLAGDPTAAWRKESQGVAARSSKYGYANPRAYLARGAHGPVRMPQASPDAQIGATLQRNAPGMMQGNPLQHPPSIAAAIAAHTNQPALMGVGQQVAQRFGLGGGGAPAARPSTPVQQAQSIGARPNLSNIGQQAASVGGVNGPLHIASVVRALLTPPPRSSGQVRYQ